MLNTIQQQLIGLDSPADRGALGPVLRALADRLSSQLVSTGGLVIKAGGSAIVKAGSALYALANGILVTKAANTDMAALVGTVTNAKFNLYAFYIDSAGTLTSVMGTEGTTLAQVRFPQTPQGKALIGCVLINPTGTGNFVGGTTPLDDATVVPNAVYINTLGAVDPTVLLGI